MCALFALMIVPVMTVGAVGASPRVYDGGSFMWPDSPGRGYLGLYIDDDISHTRLTSTLRNPSGVLCTSLNDGVCGGKTASVYAILPVCTTDAQVDCVESVGSRTQSGVADTGAYSRYFPQAGLADFVGDAGAKVPTGGSPSLWTLSGTPHSGGTEYMALVSVSGTSPSSRTSLSDVTIHASLYPVKVTAGNYSRNVPSPTSNGVSHPSVDKMANCASIADGFCAARQDFPAQTAFSVGIRLSTPPTGWLHGRIFDPSIDFSVANGVTKLRVEATPAQVPAVATWAQVDTLPASVYKAMCTAASYCNQLNPQSAGAHTSVEDWRTAFGDKAAWVRGHWMYMTLPSTYSTRCLSDTTVLHGFVTTNATGYAAGPPEFSSSDKSFTYTVASPHYDDQGGVIQGTYNFVVRSSTARCIYGITEGTMSAKVSISSGEGGDQASSAEVSVVDDGNWLRISASKFHYSSPVIKAILTSSVAPNVQSTTTTSTPKSLAFTTKKGVTATAIARFAGLKVVSGSKVRLRVAGTSARVCKVSGTSVKGLKSGSCRVTVTVTPRSGKSTSKTVLLKVSG